MSGTINSLIGYKTMLFRIGPWKLDPVDNRWVWNNSEFMYVAYSLTGQPEEITALSIDVIAVGW